MKKYNDYKKEFLAFDERTKIMDYVKEMVYYNVYFCYLNVLLKHLHEVNNPTEEWKWLRGMYKKGERYMSLTSSSDGVFNEAAFSWTYEEMLHHAAAGECICSMTFEYDTPETYMPNSVYYEQFKPFYKLRQWFKRK